MWAILIRGFVLLLAWFSETACILAAWRQLAAHFLAVHPICGSCRRELAAQVHHLEPVERRPDLALDWDNLAPVCSRCHGICNSLERRGESTAYLFAGFVRINPFA